MVEQTSPTILFLNFSTASWVFLTFSCSSILTRLISYFKRLTWFSLAWITWSLKVFIFLSSGGLANSNRISLSNRHLDYRDYIIGAVQAGLNDDLVYFQCYPNFIVRLRDADILDLVILHFKTHGFKFKEGNNLVSIITRFAYKSMTTSVGSGALCTNPKGETILFHSDVLNKSNFIIPERIMWNKVEFLDTWYFANAFPALEQISERIEQIVQYPDGRGYLVFSNSFCHSSNPRISNYEPSRASSSSIPVRTTKIEEGPTLANLENIKLTGVRSRTNLTRPFYI